MLYLAIVTEIQLQPKLQSYTYVVVGTQSALLYTQKTLFTAECACL